MSKWQESSLSLSEWNLNYKWMKFNCKFQVSVQVSVAYVLIIYILHCAVYILYRHWFRTRILYILIEEFEWKYIYIYIFEWKYNENIYLYIKIYIYIFYIFYIF